MFSSGILIEEKIDLKQNNLHLNLNELFDIGKMKESEFISLIREEQKISTKPLEIIDVEKKYQLKRIQKRSKTFGTIFESLSSLITLIVFIIITIMIYQCMRNRGYQSKENRGNTFISYNDTTERNQYTSTPNNTTSTTETDDEGMEIRLFSTPAGKSG